MKSSKAQRYIKRLFYKAFYIFQINIMKYGLLVILLEVYFICIFNGSTIFNLSVDSQSLSLLLTTLATVFATILTMVSAIVLVAFDKLKNLFSNYAYSALLKNELLIYSGVTFFFFTLFVPLSSLFIASKNLVVLVNLASFSIFLFFISIVLIAYLVFAVVRVTKPRKALEDPFSRLVKATEPPIRFRPRDQVAYSKIDQSPIYVLSEAIIRSCERRERIIPIEIIDFCGNRLQEIITEPESYKNREVINSFLPIFDACRVNAIQYGLDNVIQRLIQLYRELYYNFAEKKINLYSLIEFNQSFYNLFQELVNEEKTELVQQYIHRYFDIFINNLHYYAPDESGLTFFQEGEIIKEGDDELDNDSLWDNILSSPVSCYRIINKLDEEKNHEALSTLLWRLKHIPNECKKLELGEYQIESVTNHTYHSISNIFEKISDNGLIEDFYSGPMNISQGYNFMNENKRYSKIPIKVSSQIFISLARKGFYNKRMFRNFAHSAFSSIRELDKDISINCIKFVSRTINEIRKIFENDIHEKKVRDYYFSLRLYHDRILEKLEKETSGSDLSSLVEEVKLVNSNFNREITKEKKEYLDWPS